MTPEQREELREKAKSATPGPWFENGRIVCHEVSTRWPPVARTDMTHGMGDAGEKDRANAAFISAANPVAVTDLLDDHKRMSARIAELEAKLKELVEKS